MDKVTEELDTRPRITYNAVLAMLEAGMLQKEVAAHYEVHPKRISDIVWRGKAKAAMAAALELRSGASEEERPVEMLRKAKPGTVIWTTESNRHVTLPAVSFIAGVDRRTG